MRVLITGATGFIGQHLQSYLYNTTDWELDPTDLGNYDLVINLASISSVTESLKHPADVIRNNSECMVKALEIARRDKALLIHLSTVEAQLVTNPYAASKAAQEKIIEAYRRSYGVDAIILRSSNIIGPHQGDEKFIPTILQNLKIEEPITIYADGKRVYNPVMNVIDAIKFIAQNRKLLSKSIYTLTGGIEFSNEEMVMMIADKLALLPKIDIVSPEVERTGYAVELPKQGSSLEDVGWQPPLTLEEGLEWIKT